MVTERELSDNGLQIQYYKGDCLDTVPADQADRFTVVKWTDELFKMYHGTIPKRKPFDIDYILQLIAKKEVVQYIDYKAIFAPLKLNELRFYNTTYGLGVESIFQRPTDQIERLKAFLNEKGIEFTNEYSDAMWVYRFKISKSAANIARIKELKL